MTQTPPTPAAPTTTLGRVAGTHPQATLAATVVLRQGGNCVDAAVTGCFVALAAAPHRAGLGGDSLIHLTDPGRPMPHIISAIGTTPAAATAEAFTDAGLTTMPLNGLRAATVPGTVGGLLTCLRDHGTKTLRETLTPAIELAKHPKHMTPAAAALWEHNTALFESEWSTTIDNVFVVTDDEDHGQPAIQQRTLADFLTRWLDHSEQHTTDRAATIDRAYAAWYSGFIAQTIEEFVTSTTVLDATGDRQTGFLTAADMAAWAPTIETPRHVTYNGLDVYLADLPTQGFTVGQTLNMLAAANPGSPGHATWPDPGWLHTFIEITKLARADQFVWGCDPAKSTGITGADLNHPKYLGHRLDSISADEADLQLRPGAPMFRPAIIPAPTPKDTTTPRPGIITTYTTPLPPGDGTFITVSDDTGHTASIASTGGSIYGSPVIPDLGFALGTALAATTLHPNAAARVTPGTRPPSPLLISTIRFGDGSHLALGSIGAEHASTWHLLTIARAAECADAVCAARDIPTWPLLTVHHGPVITAPHQASLGRVEVEAVAAGEVRDVLRRRGHDVVLVESSCLGGLCATAVSPGGQHASTDGRHTVCTSQHA